ncbi:hypothetical protein ZWY2020_048888 [Hordeum vulgare]|nr:hypothetical protein ZWY2020_048888 [Hordeum vulgare]
MSNHQKHDVRLLQRTLELQKFPTGSAQMCIPVIADTYEDLLRSNTGRLLVHRSTQVAFAGTASGTSDLPHRVTSPFPGKQARKANAVMPEETASSVCPNGRHAPKNEHLMISGPLGQCDESDCVDFPLASKNKMLFPRISAPFGNEGGGWKKIWSSLPNIPVINPHARAVRRWNQFFVVSCLAAIFVNPLFFFLASMDKDNKCIMFSRHSGALTVARYVIDVIYVLHMLLQSRMAYVDPESRIVGTGDLVDEPKKIIMRYFRGAFIVDLSAMLPLPQLMVQGVIPKYIGVSGANYAKNLLRATVIVQYAPRIFRFVQLLGGQSANGFIFESAWANFVINLLVFILAGHVVGSLWYLFGLQSVNQCLRNSCSTLNITSCAQFIDCGYGIGGQDRVKRQQWFNDSVSQSCFDTANGVFKYGIYEQSVLLTTEPAINRYIYSLFWGFQQISTLAGNLVPTYNVWEVLFTKGIITLGLFLFALLVGNMQIFLQSLGKRRLEMQLRRHDVEQWMSHRHAERFCWVAMRGVNEEELLSSLPEDIQRDIRHHFHRFLNKIRLFALKDCGFCDAVCDKLKHKLYARGSDILSQHQLVEKIIFVVRGKLESINADGSKCPLHEGTVCGEELPTWWFEQQASDGERMKVHWKAIRTIRCLTNVEAFVLQFTDLERVTLEFSTLLQNPHVRLAILEDRCSNPYPDMVEVPSKATEGSCSVARNVASTNRPLTIPLVDIPDVEELFASPYLYRGLPAMLGSSSRKRESDVCAIQDPHLNFQGPCQHNLVVPGMLLLKMMSRPTILVELLLLKILLSKK